MAEASRVIVGSIPSAYIVKVIGRGTMEFCSELFDFLSMKINDEKVDDVYFELSQSSYMDSSFIGVIVSIQKKVQKNGGGDVIILNPSEKIKEILNTMGLGEILPIQEASQYKNIEMNREIAQRLEKNYRDIQILLESHQNLMELNSENKKRFSLVEEMLKKELERQKEK